jgi:hypothetical protein
VAKDTQQREGLAGLDAAQLVAAGAVEVEVGRRRSRTYTTPLWEITLNGRSGEWGEGLHIKMFVPKGSFKGPTLSLLRATPLCSTAVCVCMVCLCRPAL